QHRPRAAPARGGHDARHASPQRRVQACPGWPSEAVCPRRQRWKRTAPSLRSRTTSGELPAPHQTVRLPASDRAVPRSLHMPEAGRDEREGREHDRHQHRVTLEEESELDSHREHLLPLEPEVLERFGGPPEEDGRPPFVAAPRREIALGDPRGRAVRRRRQLCECILGLAEHRFGLVEAVLLEQRTPEHEPGVADLVQHVVAASSCRSTSSAIAYASLKRWIASSWLPSRKSIAPTLLRSRPMLARSSISSYWALAFSAYVRARTQRPSRSASFEAWKYTGPSARASRSASASSSARSTSSRAAS